MKICTNQITALLKRAVIVIYANVVHKSDDIITEGFTSELQKAVQRVLNDDERRAAYMFLSEKFNMYKEEGEKQGFALAIRRLLESGQSEQDVAALLNISVEEVQKARMMPAN